MGRGRAVGGKGRRARPVAVGGPGGTPPGGPSSEAPRGATGRRSGGRSSRPGRRPPGVGPQPVLRLRRAAAVLRRPFQPPRSPPKGRSRGRSGTSLRAARPRRVRAAGADRRPHRGGKPPRRGWGRLSTAHLPSTRASAAYGPPPPHPRTRGGRGAQNRGRGVACVNRSCRNGAGGTPPAPLSAAHWRISEPQLRKVRQVALGCCVQPLGLNSLMSGECGLLPVVVRMIPANSCLELQISCLEEVREVVGFRPVVDARPRSAKLAAGDALDGVDVAWRECVGADGA